MPAHVKKGDTVLVISGDDKGKQGRVLRVFPKTGRILVEGISRVFRHVRRSQKNPQGGRLEKKLLFICQTFSPSSPENPRGSGSRNNPTELSIASLAEIIPRPVSR